jgi:hypothetical protein
MQSVCLHRLGNGPAGERRFGRFLRNRKVTAQEIVAAAAARVGPLAAGRHVLAIQDTSELNFEAHAKRTHGLGVVGNGVDHGFFLHPVLVADASAGGGLLGMAGAQLWCRTKRKAANYRQLPIEKKESYRWLAGAEQAKQALATAAMVTVIADRESDIYEEFARLPDARTHLLTRACRDRKLATGECLYAASDALPQMQRYTVELPALKGRAARTATLALRFAPVTICRPQACPDKTLPATISLYVVDVREVDAPKDATPVHWRLLTTHAVTTIEKARQIVAWYCRRWHIEQLFRTLKRQGLDLEGSLLEEAHGLMNLAAIALIAAVRILQLTLARDGTTHQPASAAFTDEEITVLRHVQPTIEGKTAKQKNPFIRDTLAWAQWIIARLGGWNPYAGQRPAGPITMYHGLSQFDGIVRGFKVAKDVYIR